MNIISNTPTTGNSNNETGRDCLTNLPALPKYLILSLFNDLTDMNAVRTTCRDFQKCFETVSDLKLNIFLERTLKEAKRVTSTIEETSEQGESYIDLVKVLASHSPTEALETAQAIESPFWKIKALLELSKINAYNDVTALKALALTLEDPYEKTMTLCEIARIDPFHNLTEAKEAINTIDEDDFDEKYFAFMKIIEVEAQHNPHAARQWALETDDEHLKAEALCMIAKVAPSYNYDEVKTLAETLVGREKADILALIAQGEAQNDLVSAKETASTISSVIKKNKAFFEIAKLEALTNAEEARQTALKIKDTSLRAKALCEIAQIDDKHETAMAKEAVLKIEAIGVRDRLLLEIIRIEAQLSPALARQTLLMIKESSLHFYAYCEIEKVSSTPDISKLKLLAQQFEYLVPRIYASIEIAKIDPDHDFTEAKDLALDLPDPSHKANALIAIAKALMAT